MATETGDGDETVADRRSTDVAEHSTEATGASSQSGRRHGLSYRNLDDMVATLIVVTYLGIAVAMLGGWGDWSALPSTFQYWVTSAFVIALGLLFGKGVNEYRRGLH